MKKNGSSYSSSPSTSTLLTAAEKELKALKAAVLKLQPVLDWVGPICNGRSDQWKADAMKEAIALASK